MGTGCPALLDGRTGCADSPPSSAASSSTSLKPSASPMPRHSGYDNIRTLPGQRPPQSLFAASITFCLQCFCCYRRLFFPLPSAASGFCKASAADRCELNRSGHCQALQNGSAVCRAYKLHTLSGFLNCGYIGHTACAETLCQARCQVFSDLGAGKQNQLRLSFPDVSL